MGAISEVKLVKKSTLGYKLLFLALVSFIAGGLYNALLVRTYSLRMDRVEVSKDVSNDPSGTIKIALITDLHSCKYGEDEEILVDAIKKASPDVIMLAGDIFDDTLPDTQTEKLFTGLKPLFNDGIPCYYVTGNHEYMAGAVAYSEKMSIIEKYPITALHNSSSKITIKGRSFVICGLDDPEQWRLSLSSMEEKAEKDAFLEKLNIVSSEIRKEREANKVYTILLSHRPEYFSEYIYSGFDIVLTGHAHGGQWRIPFLINGLYAPNQGIFPKYAGGLYRNGFTTMIVSRGLAKESTRFIPRFYNRPELVIIELHT